MSGQPVSFPILMVQQVQMALHREVARELQVIHLPRESRVTTVWGLGPAVIDVAVGAVLARQDVRQTIRMLSPCPLPGTEEYLEIGSTQVEEHFESMMSAFQRQMSGMVWSAATEASLGQIYSASASQTEAERRDAVAAWLADMERDGPLCPEDSRPALGE